MTAVPLNQTPPAAQGRSRNRQARGMHKVAEACILAALLLATSVVSGSAEDTDSRVVDNVRIYLGIIPAAIVARTHPATHSEVVMHGGVRSSGDQYHVLIALFSETTGDRISNATVRARVAEVGLSGEERPLEPMKINDTTTYGNYFTMKGTGVSRISVVVRIPGASREISVTFQHKHE